MRPKRHRIPPRLAARSRQLRREATIPEQILWNRLRTFHRRNADARHPFRFRRQAVIGRFIVDFYCPVASLVVEIDGMSHDQQKLRDDHRTAALARLGLHVLRFTNDDVLSDVDAIVEAILRAAHARVKKRFDEPFPTPP